MESILQLKHFRLLNLTIEANHQYDPGAEGDLNYESKIGFNVYHRSEEPNVFKIPLELTLHASEITSCYNIAHLNILIEGIFTFPPGTPEDEMSKYIPLHCLTILYGIIRGLVANVTGSTYGGVFIVPALNFIEVLRSKSEEEKEFDVMDTREPSQRKDSRKSKKDLKRKAAGSSE